MKRTIILLVAAAFSVPAFAKDVGAGGEKAKQVCAACHGPDGNTPTSPDFPRLAGQHYDYLLHSLKAYKSGARKNAIMAGQAQALSEADMQNLAAFYASQKGALKVVR